MSEYLIKYWADKNENGEPSLELVHGDGVFDVIDDARENNKKVSIYRLADCVLDWS